MDADKVADNLKAKYNLKAASYHAGKDSKARDKVYKGFMDGSVKIVCATVAFGLGINKPDVRAVIHYSLPRNLESYIQVFFN